MPIFLLPFHWNICDYRLFWLMWNFVYNVYYRFIRIRLSIHDVITIYFMIKIFSKIIIYLWRADKYLLGFISWNCLYTMTMNWLLRISIDHISIFLTPIHTKYSLSFIWMFNILIIKRRATLSFMTIINRMINDKNIIIKLLLM